MSTRVVRETIVAGATIMTTIKMNSFARGQRAPKKNPTPDAVRKNNDRLAEKKLTALINANFFPGDHHVTLTYRDIKSPEDQRKELEGFIRRMKYEYKKRGEEFKYIHVTEYKGKRPHHHIVMNYIDLRIVHKQWKAGNIKASELDASRNYAALASYLIKETNKTFRLADNATKKRWCASKNLERPIVVKEVMSSSLLFDKPAAVKGYSIEVDSIQYYRHPFTQLEHLEYIQVSDDPVPRIRKWRKGKVQKRGESFRRFENIRQLAFDDCEDYSWGTI